MRTFACRHYIVIKEIIGARPERYGHTHIPWRSRVYGYRVFNKPTVSRPPADTYIPRAGCPRLADHGADVIPVSRCEVHQTMRTIDLLHVDNLALNQEQLGAAFVLHNVAMQ